MFLLVSWRLAPRRGLNSSICGSRGYRGYSRESTSGPIWDLCVASVTTHRIPVRHKGGLKRVGVSWGDIHETVMLSLSLKSLGKAIVSAFTGKLQCLLCKLLMLEEIVANEDNRKTLICCVQWHKSNKNFHRKPAGDYIWYDLSSVVSEWNTVKVIYYKSKPVVYISKTGLLLTPCTKHMEQNEQQNEVSLVWWDNVWPKHQ